jgi:hypothetical protein
MDVKPVNYKKCEGHDPSVENLIELIEIIIMDPFLKSMMASTRIKRMEKLGGTWGSSQTLGIPMQKASLYSKINSWQGRISIYLFY